jgi:hypothetical protein
VEEKKVNPTYAAIVGHYVPRDEEQQLRLLRCR